MYVSLWWRANARNVGLHYPYRQYTNLFLCRFVTQSTQHTKLIWDYQLNWLFEASNFYSFQSFQSLFGSLFSLVSIAVHFNRLQNTATKLFCILLNFIFNYYKLVSLLTYWHSWVALKGPLIKTFIVLEKTTILWLVTWLQYVFYACTNPLQKQCFLDSNHKKHVRRQFDILHATF